MVNSQRNVKVTRSFERVSKETSAGGAQWTPGKLSAIAYDGDAAYSGPIPESEGETWSVGQHHHVEEPKFRALLATMQRIPEQDIYPVFEEGFTRFNPDALLEEKYHLKRPNVSSWDGDDMHAKLLLAEVKNHEFFLQHAHPNLGGYLGCVVQDGRIVQLAFPKYVERLCDKVQRAQKGDLADFPLQELLVHIDRVEEAVDHLHALGYAHNDIGALNIMFDDDDVPVLIDLDSCTKFGGRIKKGGTAGGWLGPFEWGQAFKESSIECDKASMQYLRDWLTKLSKGQSNRNNAVRV